jgi:hypothetical protein
VSNVQLPDGQEAVTFDGDRNGVAKALYAAAQNDKGKLPSPKFSELAQMSQEYVRQVNKINHTSLKVTVR